MPCKFCLIPFAIVIILYAIMANDYLKAKKEIEFLGNQITIINAKYSCALDSECTELMVFE